MPVPPILGQPVEAHPNTSTGLIQSAVYSTDGHKILSASWDITIKEWEVKTGRCLVTLENLEENLVPGKN